MHPSKNEIERSMAQDRTLYSLTGASGQGIVLPFHLIDNAYKYQ